SAPRTHIALARCRLSASVPTRDHHSVSWGGRRTGKLASKPVSLYRTASCTPLACVFTDPTGTDWLENRQQRGNDEQTGGSDPGDDPRSRAHVSARPGPGAQETGPDPRPDGARGARDRGSRRGGRLARAAPAQPGSGSDDRNADAVDPRGGRRFGAGGAC